MKQTLLAAAAISLFAAAGTASSATITFDFQPCGNNTCVVNDVSKLDWQPGNVLAVGGAGGGSILPAGTQITDYYQANLGTGVGTANNTLFSNGDAFGGLSRYFTIVAGFRETTTLLSGGTTNVFALLPGAPNFFEVYANTTGPASDLAGTGFTSATKILSGNITSVFSSVTATSVAFPGGVPTIVANANLDNFGNNDWAGTTTISTIGGADIKAQISFVDVNYFPDLTLGSIITTALTSSNLQTPYNQTDPSRQFWNGAALIAPSIGARNGIDGPDFIFQSDSSTTFEKTVPEPSSIALVGLALLGVAGVARRKRSA